MIEILQNLSFKKRGWGGTLHIISIILFFFFRYKCQHMSSKLLSFWTLGYICTSAHNIMNVTSTLLYPHTSDWGLNCTFFIIQTGVNKHENRIAGRGKNGRCGSMERGLGKKKKYSLYLAPIALLVCPYYFNYSERAASMWRDCLTGFLDQWNLERVKFHPTSLMTLSKYLLPPLSDCFTPSGNSGL